MPHKTQHENLLSVKNEFLFMADTIPTKKSNRAEDTLIQQVPEKDTIKQKDTTTENQNAVFNQQKIDSILRISEERTHQIELEIQKEKELQQTKTYKPKTDTTAILYREFGVADFPIKKRLENDPFHQNLFLHFKSTKPIREKGEQSVFIEESPTQTTSAKTYTEFEPRKEVKTSPSAITTPFDWITIVLIVSFVLFGWIRLFHKKYLHSLLKSVISYPEAFSLYRDKNSLIQRASFIGNLLFISNVSIFVVQLSNYFNIQLSGIVEYELYLFVFACLTGLYVFRSITSRFIGFAFKKEQAFAEYFHHVNVYTKMVGLFLFPVVIVLQFLTFEYLDLAVYIGFAIVIFLYVFQLFRSFQIIIRKNVSVFYMILYLCAFEFAPFLIIYKMLLTLIN